MDGAARLAMEQVRAGDHDRYVATLYAPQEKRASLFALYAFDVEISSIRSRVREPLAGELRLQWWRDAIASGNAQGHPLAQALLQAVEEHKLPRAALDACLEARIFDLYDDPMPSTQDLEGYCGETSAAMIQLAALVLDPAGAPAAAEAAGHGGCARAMAGLLCALPFHRARGQCFVPRDILVAAGTTPESFVKGEDSAATGRAIEALVALAQEHLRLFRRHCLGLSKLLLPALLPVGVTDAYLKAVVRSGAEAAERSASISDLRRHAILLRAALRGYA